MKPEQRVRLLIVVAGGSLVLAACAPMPRSGSSGGDDDDDSGDADSGGGVFIDGGVLGDGSSGAGDECVQLHATVRDFHRTHPDFETFSSDYVATGLVQPELGADGTPVYASGGGTCCTSGPDNFAQWYHDVPGVNEAIPVVIPLTAAGPGLFAYDNDYFFPIDGMGFGNEGFNHNFHFTTEIHTSFKYAGGETFTFRGDDDLWLFINHRLAIDLGGLHQPAMQTVSLDARAAELGLEPGHVYPMDIFHAERHTVQSTFHIETTIDCFIVP